MSGRLGADSYTSKAKSRRMDSQVASFSLGLKYVQSNVNRPYNGITVYHFIASYGEKRRVRNSPEIFGSSHHIVTDN